MNKINKKIIVIITICLLLIISSVVAIEHLNSMFFEQGETTIKISELGISPDTFSVVFDKQVPNNKYTISLQGFESQINMVSDADNNAGYGFGSIVKTCQVTKQSINGFSGICHWELYLVSLAYGDMGKYPSMFHLRQYYRLEGLGNNWDLIRWSLCGKEGDGFFTISQN